MELIYYSAVFFVPGLLLGPDAKNIPEDLQQMLADALYSRRAALQVIYRDEERLNIPEFESRDDVTIVLVHLYLTESEAVDESVVYSEAVTSILETSNYYSADVKNPRQQIVIFGIDIEDLF